MSRAIRSLARRARRAAARDRRGRHVLIAASVIALLAAPAAVSATGGVLRGGERNPSGHASQELTRETQIIGEIAQNQGGFAAQTGGYTTRQSNKSDSGGGAIYGCRAKAGTESCVAANNLANGDAFRLQATPSAGTVGQIRFGTALSKLVDKPPFATNGTGLVKNLNADRVDGHSADEFVATGSLLFAVVANDGAVGANRGVPQNGRATVANAGGNTTFTVPFSSDVSACAATASPTDPDAPQLAVATGADKKSVVITEKGAAAPFGFHLQVTC